MTRKPRLKSAEIVAIKGAASSDADQASPVITAASRTGLTVTTWDGKPAHLAVIDSRGRVIAAGREVEHAAWEASVLAYREFLIGQGHMRVLRRPESSKVDKAA